MPVTALSSYTAQQAYDAIKSLEAQGRFPLPLGAQTVRVGTFDAASSQFAYSVPTFVDTETLQPPPVGGKPQPPIEVNYTIGTIAVNAVDLLLQFDVTNSQGPFTVEAAGITVTAPAHPVVAARTRAIFPPPVFRQHVTLDLGILASPPNGTFDQRYLMVQMWCGTAQTTIYLQLLRPPSAAVGAFTLPAVPVALIFAPPPGPQNKNYAEYSNMTASTRKVSTTFSSGSTSKTGTAYSTGDFVDKISGVVSGVQNLIGAFSKNPIFAQIGSSISLGLTLLSGVLSSTTTSTSDALTTTSEHDLQTTDTETTTFGTPTGLGPGFGDRFVYLRNVRVVWMIVDNELSFSVLGDDGIAAWTAQQLIADSQSLALSSGALTSGPITGLDAATLATLLGLDPFAVLHPRPILRSPTLDPPRFVPADPASYQGGATDPGGDVISVSHDVTTTDTTTTNSVTTTITDYKPGWMVALVGSEQATENQCTLGYTTAKGTGSEQKQTASVYLFSGPSDSGNSMHFYFDLLFGTFAFQQWPPPGPVGPPVGPVTNG